MSKGEGLPISRRNMVAASALGMAAATGGWGATASAQQHKSVKPSRAVRGNAVYTPSSAIVPTIYGPVRGYVEGETFVFKGIRYAATTAGANRFRLAQPPEPWRDPYLAFAYGPICPQLPFGPPNPMMQFIAWADDRIQSEDCLNLNIWSPALDKTAKLPVLVWLHGGGFTAGSSRENAGYEGLNLSRRGAVVVTINHRLGPLGFMNLADGGGDFGSSGNVGMLDMVAALRWVRDNIDQFGGDPSRVTIFGQSGGGAKVSTLMAMPAAKGLFHRAVVMSGSPRTFASHESSRKLATATAQAAGFQLNDVASLQQLEPAALLKAAKAAEASLTGSGRLGWQPSLHPSDLPTDWSKGAPQQSANIPLIVGSVRDEFRPLGLPQPMTGPELLTKLTKSLGADAPAAIESLRAAFPAATPFDMSAIIGGMTWRNNAVEQATKHAALGAPVYHYYYTLPSPLLDGGIGVPHGSDVDAFFDNVEKQPALTGRRPEAFALAEIMSGQLIAFAAQGAPDYGPIQWERFDPRKVNTMMFENPSRMVNDPASAARKIVASKLTGPFG